MAKKSNKFSRMKRGMGRRPGYRRDYSAYRMMIGRCEDHLNASYRWYGAKGVTVHPTFKGRKGFRKFMEEIGPRPTRLHTIDRKENSKGYEPGNLRWATKKEQSDNRSSVRKLTARGQTKTLADWARHLGITSDTLYLRRKRGWPEERLLDPVMR